MPRKIKLILNPMADMRGAWRVGQDLRSLVAEYGHADWSGTVYPGHAVELAKQAAEEGYDIVVAVGGDGTVHEVVNGLMQIPAKKRPILGVIPVGSGNDFAFAVGAPKQANLALQNILTLEPQTVDIGLMTDENGRTEYFDNSVGIGFNAMVTIHSHKIPVIRGFLMYLVSVIQTILFNHHPMKLTIETDGETWEQSTIMLGACNGPREGGGFMVAPDAKNSDGKLNYTIITNLSRPMMFRLIPEVMGGTHGKFKQVKMGEFKKMTLKSDRPLYIHMDGEIYTNFGSNLRGVTFEILPNALKVIRG